MQNHLILNNDIIINIRSFPITGKARFTVITILRRNLRMILNYWKVSLKKEDDSLFPAELT